MAYSIPHHHSSMVFDKIRNATYYQALKNIITPDSIVLDLGAGLGVHGMMAAQLGAKKVYMVEPEKIIDLTKKMVEKNGYSDRVECIQGKIEEVELPEQVDIIVSVFTGNFLLMEDLLPSLFYARDKYLKTGGYLIPDQAKMFAYPIHSSHYSEQIIQPWTKPHFDLDFNASIQTITNDLYLKWVKEDHYEALSEKTCLLDLDFYHAQQAACAATETIDIIKDGTIDFLLGWFDIKLGNAWLSTSAETQKTHWRQALMPIYPPLASENGMKVSLKLNRPQRGEWSWQVANDREKRQHSTFFTSLYRSIFTKTSN